MSAEVVFVAGYALLLTSGAFVLEWLSAHTHRRALRFRTAGFTYDATHDHWSCPEGEHLWPHELDRERRLVRYRARAQTCNACRLKPRCTDSDRGREIVRPLDPWPRSEAGRFHRVIAFVMVVLSGVIALAELVRHHRPLEALLLLALVVALSAAGRWLVGDLLRHPVSFPQPTPSHGLRIEPKP